MVTRYVNTASSPGGDGTTNATSGDSRAFASLNEAEAALPSSFSDSWRIVCEGQAADTAAVSFSGYDTTASHSVEVWADPAATYGRHDGKWNENKYRLVVSVSGTNAIYLYYCGQVNLTGIQARNTHSSGDSGIRVLLLGSRTTTIDSCLFSSGGNLGWAAVVLGDHPTTSIYRIRNSVFVSNLASGDYSVGIYDNGSTTVYLDNCVLVSSRTGGFGYKRTSASGAQLRNCYASGAGGAYSGSGYYTLTNCASADTTGSAGLQGIAYSTSSGAKFTSITVDAEDFHIQAGSALIDAGSDLSGDFSTDIDGQTRSGTWDIGIDEIAGGDPDPITGTIAASIAAPTASATAALAFTGTVAASIGAPTATATASLEFTGAAAVSIPAPTSAASASLGFSGTITASVPAPTASASGSLEFSASAAASIAAPTATAQALLEFTGTAAASIGAPTCAATAETLVSYLATVAVSIPAPTCAAEATYTPLAITGAIAASVPAPTCQATATADVPAIEGEIAASVPAPGASATAALAFSGTAAGAIPAPTASASGTLLFEGAIAAQIGAPTAAAEGTYTPLAIAGAIVASIAAPRCAAAATNSAAPAGSTRAMLSISATAKAMSAITGGARTMEVIQ